MSSPPKLSIVVTGRNDDYGGDFNARLQKSVSWWSRHLSQYHISAEYLFVNWNPLPDKPSLLNTVDWSVNKFFEVKFIEVPPAVHAKFNDPAVRKPNQLYEFIAKNTGIRRATGEYILSTNADILLDPGVFEFMAKDHLSPDTFYRADRYDFHTEENPVDDPLESIRKNVFEIKGFGAAFSFNYNGDIESSVSRFKKKNQRFLKWQLIKRKYDKFFSRLGFSIVYDNAEYHTHVNAAGDFLLMHQGCWSKLRGYDETFFHTLHNDAELVFNAHASDLQQKVMFYPVYHQHHERRYSDANPGLQKETYETYKAMQQKAQRLLQTRKPEIANGPDWGLVDYELEVKHLFYGQ